MSYNPEQLKRLFQEAKEGNQDAFGELFTEFYKPIYSYLFIRLHDDEKVKELTQDVFLKVYASLPTAYIHAGSPLAYFYTVAKNTLIDYFRKKKDIFVEDQYFADIASDTMTAADETDHAFEMKRVMHIIATLPEEQEKALLLRYLEDKPYSYIARVLQKNEAAVRQLISRALKLLRSKIE